MMNLPWFKRKGIFFIPVSIVGWVLLLSALICAVYVFITIDNKRHSGSDALMNFVFHLIIIGAIYSSIAFLTSRKQKA